MMRLNSHLLIPKKRQKQLWRLVISVIMGMILSLWGGNWQQLYAQTPQPEMVAAEVYQQLKYLPLENQYINKETGKPAENNTLISRVIRYNIYVKQRSLERLDWQLTMADYLGVNETILEEKYPGHSVLETLPFNGDRDAINQLTRRQRRELVDTLTNIYNPQTASQPKPSAPPEDPQPGDAKKLLIP